jgi:hypothetical protein
MATENSIPVVDPVTYTPAQAAERSEAGSLFSVGELQLTLVILFFGVLSLAIFYLLVRSQLATPFLMRAYVVIILVFGTLLIVSSAYSTEQIAPIVGFFGTIAGYLLGRTDRPNAGTSTARGSSEESQGD